MEAGKTRMRGVITQKREQHICYVSIEMAREVNKYG